MSTVVIVALVVAVVVGIVVGIIESRVSGDKDHGTLTGIEITVKMWFFILAVYLLHLIARVFVEGVA